jgi:hypothetical protein
MQVENLRRSSRWMFSACGVWLIALGIYFIFVRPSLLPEDYHFLGVNIIDVQKHLPRLSEWLQHVFTVMGGFIAGCGILVLFMATRVLPQHLAGSTPVLGITGLVTVGVMSWINFLLDSNFKWLLLIPAMLWLVGLVIYWISVRFTENR